MDYVPRADMILTELLASKLQTVSLLRTLILIIHNLQFTSVLLITSAHAYCCKYQCNISHIHCI